MKYSSGTLPHEAQMISINLYGTEVMPRVGELLQAAGYEAAARAGKKNRLRTRAARLAGIVTTPASRLGAPGRSRGTHVHRSAAFRTLLLAGVAACAAAFQFPADAASQAPAARTVWDGVYTLDQAKRGALKSGLCAGCHGDGFEGASAPQLVGEPFVSRWEGRTVGDLFDLIRLTMPDDDPGSLAREEYADLVAYILAVNKFPTGSGEIGTSIEPLQQIQIVATKP